MAGLSQNINIAAARSVGIAAVASICLAQLAGQFSQGRLRTLPLNASNRRYGATLAGVSNSHSGPIAAKGLNGDGAIALNADIHAPSIRALKRMKQDAAA